MTDDDVLIVPPDPFEPPRPAPPREDHCAGVGKMIEPPPDPPRREAKQKYVNNVHARRRRCRPH